MKQFSAVKLDLDGSAWRPRLSGFRVPLAALAFLEAMLSVTVPYKVVEHPRGPLEIFAHYLGHEINSIWVGMSLVALAMPALLQFWRRGENPIWAWRAVDAVLLDYIFVDALGKSLFTFLGRPGHPDKPGFPSGHATMAFLVAWLVWRRFPKLGPVWFALAALIAWSRVEVHAHYGYQVFSGALLGSGLGALIIGRRAGVLVPQIFLSDREWRRELVSEKV